MTNREMPAGALSLVRDVFARLNADGVRYCHWKSTSRLELALAGGTDLDLLVARADADPFTTAVRQTGFKPFVSHPSRRYPDVEDWLGHDDASGRLVHLHVYYRLVLGEDYVKNHVLPIEDALLATASLRHGVLVPSPAAELVVLVIRALLKYRRTDALKDALKLGRRGGVPPDLRAEVEDLAARVSGDELRAAAGQLVPYMDAAIFTRFVEVLRVDRRDARTLLELRAAARRQLRAHERLPRLQAALISLRARLVRAPVLRQVLRPLQRSDLRRKSPAAGGLTVAVIGADGAGKSTVIGEIVRWLGWRLNVQVVYLGSASPSTATGLVQGASRLTRRAASAASRLPRVLAGPIASVAGLTAAIRYLAEGRERAARVEAGRSLAAAGTLVLFDRYPLDWVRLPDRPVDGPRIGQLNGRPPRALLAMLRRREESIYRRIPEPDLVLLLTVPADVALQRKASARPDAVRDKAQAVLAAARRTDGERVVSIDATQPLEAVLRQVEAEVWRRLG